MSMSSFAPYVAPLRSAPLDPTKHVNYSLGMVLGVDDFTQEFAYLAGRDQWMARELFGYGTLRGLLVRVETDAQGPRVIVTPGVALSPRGQLICVTPTQCAYLNKWSEDHKDELIRRFGSPGAVLQQLSVVLCYRDCPTDQVPIAGEPCRTEEESMAPSRLADDFKLELRFAPPEQREEDALRDFVAWLDQVQLTDNPDEAIALPQFEAAIRAAARLDQQPLASPPDFLYGSPPDALRVPRAGAGAYLSAAFRIWATELRPRWPGTGAACATPPDEECLLLAELTLPSLSSDWKVINPTAITLDEQRRPYLIHLRLLQEWLSYGWREQPSAGAPAAPNMLMAASQPYGMVAAGMIRGDGSSTLEDGTPRLVHNGLRVLRTAGPGLLNVTFDNYTKPDGTFQYIVKALPVANAAIKAPIVSFAGFLNPAAGEDGFLLRVNDGAKLVTEEVLKRLELMIEVSR